MQFSADIARHLLSKFVSHALLCVEQTYGYRRKSCIFSQRGMRCKDGSECLTCHIKRSALGFQYHFRKNKFDMLGGQAS